MLTYLEFLNESKFPEPSKEVIKDASRISNMTPEEYLKSKGCYQNSDGTWSKDGNLSLTQEWHSPIIKDGKFIVKFKQIKGYFWCNGLKLTTLAGCPDVVNGGNVDNGGALGSNSFACSDNPIFTLEGCPQVVGGDFKAENTSITDLQGLPIVINGDFHVDYNEQLTSLKGSPKIVHGKFFVSNNPKLKSLKDGPKEVGVLRITDNGALTSLEGAPELIGDISMQPTWYIPNVPEVEHMWYLTHGINGYNHYFNDLLKYITKTDISLLNTVNWPKGYLNKHLSRSAKSVSKFKL